MSKDIEREISAHEIDCKINELKERFSVFFDEDEVENLIQLSMNLGKLFAKRDLDKKPDGCVVVPVEPTPKMIDSTWDYQDEINNMSHNSRNAFIYKNMIRVAIEEAARGGNE